MCNIAIFEDEPVLQMMWEDIAEANGFEVTGICNGAEHTDMAGTASIDVAVLDVNLDGEVSDDILQVLEERGIPVLVCTGLPREDLPTMFQRHNILQKPFGIPEAGRLLKRLCKGTPSLV